jgi:hypothetical protein
MMSLRAECDAVSLQTVIPGQCRARGATIEVQIIELLNLGWLAGRGYNIVAVRVPVTLMTSTGERDYVFTPVLWESEADPVLTGREELGSPKLFANIPAPRRLAQGFAGSASWDGFCFFDWSADDLNPKDGAPEVSAPNLLYKYFPRTGAWSTPDVAHFTTAVPGQHPPAMLLEHRVGHGRFAFHHARWEDMPTQFSFVNRLADLPISGVAQAVFTYSDGIADLRAQAILDI